MALRGALRDIVILVGVFALLLGGLYLFTGTWPPAVIVESGSMMHPDSDVSYGRSWLTFGPATIDPGDLVLVKDVDTVDDVETLVEGGKERYGMPGDVIVYYPANDRAKTPIIHRAVAYVEVKEAAGEKEYWVRWNADTPCEGGAVKAAADPKWCVYDEDGILIPSVPVAGFGHTPRDPNPYKPIRSGFITKGDNPSTNSLTDQISQLSRDEQGNSSPVMLEWIEGKGRAELPWLGLIKLSLAPEPNEPNPPRNAQGEILWTKIGNAYAPKDLWVMLGVALFLLIGVPLLYDAYRAFRARQARIEEEAQLAAGTTSDAPPPPPPPSA